MTAEELRVETMAEAASKVCLRCGATSLWHPAFLPPVGSGLWIHGAVAESGAVPDQLCTAGNIWALLNQEKLIDRRAPEIEFRPHHWQVNQGDVAADLPEGETSPAHRFRHKPTEITAAQWFPGLRVDGVAEGDDGVGTIKTLEGLLLVRPGDWVVTGTKGEKYSVREDIFRETYALIPGSYKGMMPSSDPGDGDSSPSPGAETRHRSLLLEVAYQANLLVERGGIHHVHHDPNKGISGCPASYHGVPASECRCPVEPLKAFLAGLKGDGIRI